MSSTPNPPQAPPNEADAIDVKSESSVPSASSGPKLEPTGEVRIPLSTTTPEVEPDDILTTDEAEDAQAGREVDILDRIGRILPESTPEPEPEPDQPGQEDWEGTSAGAEDGADPEGSAGAKGEDPATAAQAAEAWADQALETVLEADDVDVAMEPGPVEVVQNRLTREDHHGRIAFYEQELAEETDKARAALLEHEIGDQLERLQGDEAGAVKSYARSLASDPMLRPNLWAVRRIFYRRRLWPSLVKLLDAEARYASSDAERAELWTERGHVMEDCLGDETEALRCYRTAHRLDPLALAPLSALEALFTRQGDGESLLEAQRAQAVATKEAGRKVALLLELARAELRQSVPAKEGSAEPPPVARALSYLHGAYEVGVDQLRVVDEIVRITLADSRIEECLAALDVKAEILDIQAETAQQKRQDELTEEIVAIRRWQAKLSRERIHDGELAWQYLQTANSRSPGDPLLLHDLLDLAESQGRWGEVDALLSVLSARRQAARPDAPPSLGLLLLRARALRLAARDPEAETLEREVAARAPGHLPLLLYRERRALAKNELTALSQLFEQEADVALSGLPLSDGNPRPDPQWAQSALLRAGSCLIRAGEYTQACQILRRAQTLGANLLCVELLAQALERAGNFAELRDLYEGQLESTDGERSERALRLREVLVSLCAGPLLDPARALLHNGILCQEYPDDLRLLTRQADLARKANAPKAEHTALLRIEALSPPGIDAILRRAELLRSPEIADVDGAIALYEEALRLSPGEPRALTALSEMLHQTGRYQVLYDLLRRQVDACALGLPGDDIGDGDRSGQLLNLQVRLADLCEQELALPDEATAVWRDVLIRRPGYKPALSALCRLYERLGDLQRLSDTLELLSAAFPQGQARALCLLRLAEVHEHLLLRQEAATDAYQRARHEATEHPRLLAHATLGILRTLAARRAFAELPVALAGILPLLPSDPSGNPEPLALVRQIREVEGYSLGTLTQAEWDEWRGENPEAPPLPAFGLLRQASTQKDGAKVAEALALLSDHLESGEGAAAFALRAGIMTMLAEPSTHFAHLKTALSRAGDPGTRLSPQMLVPVCDALEGAPLGEPPLSGIPDLLQARESLAPGERDRTWRLLTAEALLQTGEVESRHLAAQAALSVVEFDQGEGEGTDEPNLTALYLLRAATAPSPLGATVEELAAHARYVLRLAGQLRDPERRASLYQEAADHLRLAGQNEEAAAALRAVLDLRPGDPVAFGQAYELLLQRAGNFQEAGEHQESDPGPLLELLNHRLAFEPATDAARSAERPLRIALLLQRAAMRQAALQDALAIVDLRAVLGLDPAHRTARRRLADLLAGSGQVEESLTHYERFLELEHDEEERRAVHIQVAALVSETEPARAAEHLRHAIAIGRHRHEREPGPMVSGPLPALTSGRVGVPESVGAEGALYRWQVKLLLFLQRWTEAVEVLSQMAALIPEGRDHGIELARVELEIADILYYQAKDPRGSLSALTRALESDPLSLEALDRLVPLCNELAEHKLPARFLQRALIEARSQAAAQPAEELSGEPYHGLVQIYSWLGWRDAHTLALQAESILSGGNRVQPPPLRVPPIKLSPLSSLISARSFAPEARGLMLDFWREVFEVGNEMLGPDLPALFASPKERLNARQVPASWMEVDQLCLALGLGNGTGLTPYSLHLSREKDLCQIAGSSLVCGSAYGVPLSELPQQHAFRLLQRLALLPERMGPVLNAGSEDLLLFVAACCRLAEVRGPELLPVHALKLEERVRQLGKLISRKERRGLVSLVPRLDPLSGERGRELVSGWQQAVILGAARTALAISGNLQATVFGLGLSLRESDQRATQIGRSLLLFAVSGEILEMRREFGLFQEEGQRGAV